MSHPIVRDEVALLARVAKVLEERPYVVGPSEDDLVADLVRLRDEMPRAKEEDKGSLLDQYHQSVSLLEQIRESKGKPQVDPDCPYFAHLRLREDGKDRDLCLGRATRIEAGVRVVDWRNAPVSRIFYRYAQGDEYDEEMGDRSVVGEVVARRTVSIHQGRVERIDCPEGVFYRDHDGGGDEVWKHRDREELKLHGGQGAALRAHQAGEGVERRLGTDLAGNRRRQDKRLPDIAGLLDPEQFAIITRPTSGFVVVRGSAGSGKTTVALHRIAWLAYEDPEIDSPRTLFVVFSPALRDYVGHVLPALGVKRAVVTSWREWSVDQRRRHFPHLPKAVRDDTPAVVVRLKTHPAMMQALEEHVRRHKGPATADQAVDDWTSVLVHCDELLPPVLDEVSPGAFSAADLRRAAQWCRDRNAELLGKVEDEEKQVKPELDAEDDALLLRAWQLRVGPLRGKGGAILRLRHLAIDEVQDFSPIEVRVLLETLDQRQSITLAGDTQQHVMQESGFTSWEAFFRHLGVQGTSVDTLKISYRCSAEVMRFAMALLGDLREDASMPESTRSGPPVETFRFTDTGACVAFLADALDALLHEEPLASVAVLTPAPEVSQAYYGGLQHADVPRLRLVENQSFTFAPGVEVTEIEQVKGLEFDYVILVEVNASRFSDTPSARRVLHVGATRAVHQLWVCSVGTPSSVLTEAIAETAVRPGLSSPPLVG